MANKYSLAALDAVEMINHGTCNNPSEAWDKALQKYYERKSSSFNKGCPKNAFLGLCEEGLIVGIGPGKYTKSKKNKAYAVKATEYLKQDPGLAKNIEELWEMATDRIGKVHNSQMDIVVALWKKNLIK